MRTLPLTHTLQAGVIKSSNDTHLLGWLSYPINRVFQLIGLKANLEYNKFKPPLFRIVHFQGLQQIASLIYSLLWFHIHN